MSTWKSWTCAGVAVAGLMFSAAYVAAEPPVSNELARLTVARQLLDLTGGSKIFEGLVPSMLAQLQQQLVNKVPNRKSDVEAVLLGMAEKYNKRNAELLDELAAHYAKTLSEDDMKEVIRFFSSGPGQHYVQAIPTLTQGSAAIAKAWGQKISSEIVKEAETELRKRGVPL